MSTRSAVTDPGGDVPEVHRGNARPIAALDSAGAVFCAVLWGCNSAAVKFAGESFAPCTLAGLRFLLAFVTTGIWASSQGYSLKLQRHQIVPVLANGVLLFVQIGLFTVGTLWSTSVHSVILVNVFPFFTAWFTRLMIPEMPLTQGKLVGLAIAFVGVTVMFADHLTLPDRAQLWGDLLLVASAAILGFKVTYSKIVLDRVPVVPLIFWEAVVSVPLFLLASALFETAPTAGITSRALASVVFQGCFVSSMGYLIWTALLGRLSPNDLSAFSFLTPALGTLFGGLVLGESWTFFLFAGGTLTMAGVALVTAR